MVDLFGFWLALVEGKAKRLVQNEVS